MALLSFAELEKVAGTGFSTPYTGGVGLKNVLQQLRGIKQTVIDGGAAGDHTLTGISVDDDHLISVVHIEGDGTQLTGGADLTAEFTITDDDTINNAGGTSSANGVLLVTYFDYSAGA